MHCADLLNGFTFHGKQYVLPEHIQMKNQNSALPNTRDKDKRKISIYRDIVINTKIQMKTTIITIENQSDIHYAMPVRIMSGDNANYHNQWRKIAKIHKEHKDLTGMEFLSGFSKEDKLTPVSTIVVYFGADPWDGPRCLKDMLDLKGFPQEMIDFIGDYPINLLEVRNFSDYEIFQSDFKYVCGFLQRHRDANALQMYLAENEEQFKNLAEDALQLIDNYSNFGHLLETRELYQTETGGIDMCKAIEDMIENGKQMGIELGMERGIERGLECGIERGIQSLIKICQEFGVTFDATLHRIIAEFTLTEDKAHEYMKKYWN